MAPERGSRRNPAPASATKPGKSAAKFASAERRSRPPARIAPPPLLRGQRALVTGASGGIGAAIAAALAGAGAEVWLHYGRGRGRAEAVARRIAAGGGRARVIAADLRRGDAIAALARALPARLDILVHCAGLWGDTPLGETAEPSFDDLAAVNFKAPFWLTQALLPALRRGARIVNVSSVAGRTGVARRSLYGATKAALDAYTRSWALELAPRGIRVNAVAPGYVLTRMTASHFADAAVKGRALARHPFGRFTRAAEVAAAVLFLCSPASAGITGQILNVSGGFVI